MTTGHHAAHTDGPRIDELRIEALRAQDRPVAATSVSPATPPSGRSANLATLGRQPPGWPDIILTNIDTSGPVHIEERRYEVLEAQMRLLRHLLGRMAGRVVGPVEFCERCGRVCDARCRAEALCDQARTRALTAGWPGPR